LHTEHACLFHTLIICYWSLILEGWVAGFGFSCFLLGTSEKHTLPVNNISINFYNGTPEMGTELCFHDKIMGSIVSGEDNMV